MIPWPTAPKLYLVQRPTRWSETPPAVILTSKMEVTHTDILCTDAVLQSRWSNSPLGTEIIKASAHSLKLLFTNGSKDTKHLCVLPPVARGPSNINQSVPRPAGNHKTSNSQRTLSQEDSCSLVNPHKATSPWCDRDPGEGRHYQYLVAHLNKGAGSKVRVSQTKQLVRTWQLV